MIAFKNESDLKLWEKIDKRIVELAEYIHGQAVDRGLCQGIVITSTIRAGGGVHGAKRAADIRSFNFNLDATGKCMFASEMDSWAQKQFGPWTKSYVIFEWPLHPKPELQNPEHFHLQVPAWGTQIPEV
jgi:hypothetical protein